MKKLYKLVVTGAFNAGKTTFVSTLSDLKGVNTDKNTHLKNEAKVKSSTTVALDYGQVKINGSSKVHLFGTPGQARFDFMHELLADGMHGFIFLVDTTDPKRLKQSSELLDQFKARGQHVPYLLVANKIDCRSVSDTEIRKRLKLSPQQPIVSCVATDKKSTRAVLEQLVTIIESGASY